MPHNRRADAARHQEPVRRQRLGLCCDGDRLAAVHILGCLVIYSFIGRAAPYGDSAALWFATGVVPFLAFQYISRFIVLGVVMNLSLLSFPVVKVTDIVFAGA